MVVGAMRVALLETDAAEVLATARAVEGKLLAVLFTVGKGVDLVDPLDVVIVHHPPVVVIFGALLTEIELFVGAVHHGPPVLAIHALVLALQELLLVADHKMHLILNLVAPLISHHEVVLKGLPVTVTLQQHRICHAELILNGGYLPELQLAE